jgi:hypothetical protein
MICSGMSAYGFSSTAGLSSFISTSPSVAEVVGAGAVVDSSGFVAEEDGPAGGSAGGSEEGADMVEKCIEVVYGRTC